MRILLTILAITVLIPIGSMAQEPCPDPATSPDAWKQALLQVDSYRSTYVLVYPDRLAERFPTFGPSTDGKLRIAALGAPAAELSRKAGMQVSDYAVKDGPDQIVRDVLEQRLDGAVMWAPLAGWMVQKLDTGLQLSMRSSTEPFATPEEFAVAGAQSPDPAAIAACSEHVRFTLESYGVVPSEPFQLDIFQIVARRSPVPTSEGYKEGSESFQRYCASCHGTNAVMVSSLAPVDLLKSIRKFTYGGFSYITLKGRNMKGMPGYHGILDEEDLEKIFQYISARSSERMAQK